MSNLPMRIDMHVHVGVLGDLPGYERYGHISLWMRKQLTYRIMLLYAGVPMGQASDRSLEDAVIKTVTESGMDRVVCLALDPVYEPDGTRREEFANMWVANEFIIERLIPRGNGKILLGASVHPYDKRFDQRLQTCITSGAVLLKWLPSAQWINLASPIVRTRLESLAAAKLPLLLHVGAEYAIMTTDPATSSYDFLSWDWLDRLRNQLRRKSERWSTPDIPKVLDNLKHGVEKGATIILAHCGLPYFAPRFLGFLEHSDLKPVRQFLRMPAGANGGSFYADVSALITPFRKSFFGDVRKLPASQLLTGSDFPVPVFELSADIKENLADFRAMIDDGDLDRILVPQDNLLDVNWRELKHAFGEHPMFRNAERVFGLSKESPVEIG